VITGVTEIVHITTKQDMSRWTRAHTDVPGIKWSVFAGPGGTMIIVEWAEDRCTLNRPDVSPDAAVDAISSVERADIVAVSALTSCPPWAVGRVRAIFSVFSLAPASGS
jgi:hypothetical protein